MYYKQGSHFEDMFDSDLKQELSKREEKRADAKKEIKKALEKRYTITDSDRDNAILNAKAMEGYQDEDIRIEGVPAVDRSRYDKDENLIE
jgi:hypothetical protein